MIKKYVKLLIIFIAALFITNIVVDIAQPNFAFAKEDFDDVSQEDLEAEQDEYDSQKCSPQKYKKKFKNCLFCPLFSTFYSAVSIIAAQSFNTFAEPVAQVVEIAFALWIAFKLITFSSLGLP